MKFTDGFEKVAANKIKPAQKLRPHLQKKVNEVQDTINKGNAHLKDLWEKAFPDKKIAPKPAPAKPNKKV